MIINSENHLGNLCLRFCFSFIAASIPGGLHVILDCHYAEYSVTENV